MERSSSFGGSGESTCTSTLIVLCLCLCGGSCPVCGCVWVRSAMNVHLGRLLTTPQQIRGAEA